MYYRHNLDYSYPEKCDEHMITVKHVRDVTLDENYPYLEKGLWFGIRRAVCWVLVHGVLSWLTKITHGLRIYGRKNLRKHKEAFKNGAITIANHVFMWDFICVMLALSPRMAHFPAWSGNLVGPNGPLIRMSGGIPVPTNSLRAMVKFKHAVEEVLESKKWLHYYPEGSMWFYYPDVRPFKKSVFQYAVKYDRPIIPLAFSFRPRRGLLKHFVKTPLVDLHIGEPIFADKSLGVQEAVKDLQARAYHIMQGMCGIFPGDPTYNADQNPENYKKTM